VDLTVVPIAQLTAEERDLIVALCSSALLTDCSSLFGYLVDPVHVLARDGTRLVGHACWTERRLEAAGFDSCRTAWIDAVAVAPDLQQRGIGTRVMTRLAEEIAGFDLGALGTERSAFYERLGWERWAGSTEGVLHDPLDTLMILRTKNTPPIDTRSAIATA
jgi:aminoglycoside 2'-N-acetyltransferase I